MNPSLGIIFALISMAGYGLSNAISKPAAKGLGSQKTLFYRNIVVSLILFLLLLANFKNAHFSGFYVFVALLISLVGYVPIIAFYEAIKRGKVGIIAPIGSSSLIVTIFLSLVFLKETLTGNQIAAILFIVFGIVLISVNFKDFKNSHLFSISSGVPFALIACFGWGLVFFLLKFPVTKLGPVFSGFILETGLVFISGVHLRAVKSDYKVNKTYYKYIFLMALGVTAGTLFYGYGINVTSVSIVAAISGCAPLVATMYGKLVYKEKLSIQQYLAGIMVVFGIIALSL